MTDILLRTSVAPDTLADMEVWCRARDIGWLHSDRHVTIASTVKATAFLCRFSGAIVWFQHSADVAITPDPYDTRSCDQPSLRLVARDGAEHCS